MIKVAKLKELTETCTNLDQYLKVQDEAGTKRVLLRGAIVSFLDIARENRVTGNTQLFFKDQSGCIACVVPSKTTWTMGQEVLCTKWNIIVKGEDKWLELIDLSPCGSMTPNVTLSLNKSSQTLISVQTAVKLWHIRKLLQLSSVCIKGCINCMTEVSKYKGSLFCVVKVEDGEHSFNILIQDKQFFWWQHVLVVQECYIFADLVPTSLKVCTENLVLYVPTATSWLHTARDSDHDIPITEYDDFVAQRSRDLGLEADQGQELLNYTFLYSGKLSQPLSVCTYKGKITDTAQRGLGIYELDDKIRLYTNGSQPVHNYDILREGMEITVYNAHHRGHPKPPKIRLCCCEWSCIKIDKIPVYMHKEKEIKKRTLNHKLLNKYSRTLCHLEWLLETQEKLTEKLAPRIVRQSSIDFLLEKVLSLVISEEKQWKPDLLLHLLGNHDNSCYAMNKQGNVPVCVSIKELCNMAKTLVPDNANTSSKDASNQPSSSYIDIDKLDWTVVQKCNDQLKGRPVLIGQLKTNKKTANIHLVDLTGSVDCVICKNTVVQSNHFINTEIDTVVGESCAENTVLKKHICHCLQPEYLQKAVIDTSTGGCKFTKSSEMRLSAASESCEYAHIKDLGELYLVRKFTVCVEQCETVPSVDTGHGTESSQGTLKRYYVQFSIEDAVKLSTTSINRPEEVSQGKHKDRDTKNASVVLGCSVCNHTCTFGLGDGGCKKQRLSTNEEIAEINNRCTENNKQRMLGSQGCSTSYSVPKTEMLPHTSIVCQPFILLHKDSLQVKCQTTNQPKLVFYALACFICRPYILPDSGLPHKLGHQSSSTRLCDPLSQSGGTSKSDCSTKSGCSSGNIRQVALVFEESSVKWYHVLNVGQTYNLCKEKSGDVSVFQPRCSSQILKKALLKSGAKMLLPVEDNMVIREQSLENQCQLKDNLKEAVAMVKENALLPQVFTVAQLLQNDREEKLVSLCGVITGRRHIDKHRENQGLKYTTPRQVSKEMYKLGALIPQDYTIELTLADINTDDTLRVFINPDMQFYQIGLLCGSQVLMYKLEFKKSSSGSLYCQYLSASSCRVIGTLGLDWKQLHQTKQDYKRTAESCSHICEVLYGKVGGLITIFPTVQRVLKIALKHVCSKCCRVMSILIDDGTSNAMMYCSGENVFKLLGLNRQQQVALEELVRKQGAVVLDQTNCSDESPTHTFIKLLLSSSLVKRRLSLKVKHRGKFFGSYKKAHKDLTLCDVPMKKLSVGDTELHSYCLPLPQLDCVSLSEVNPTLIAKLLLYKNA